MAKLVVYRLLAFIPMLLAISVLAFLMLHLAPTDPALLVVGPDAGPEAVEAVRAELGLDRPLLEQFGSWLGGAVVGDFGESLFTGRPVMAMIVARLPITLPLAVGGIVLAVVVGLSGGIIASLRQGSALDRGLLALASLGTAVPGFWIGLLLSLAFGLWLGLLPVVGYAPLSDGIGTWARHMTLPVVALAIRPAAIIARQTRNSMVEVLSSELIQSVRARGLPPRLVVLRYALKNGLIPTVTTIGLQAALILVVSFVIERVFAFPGIGSLVVDSVVRSDFPVVQGTLVVVGGAAITVYLLVDIAYGIINPRARPQ